MKIKKRTIILSAAGTGLASAIVAPVLNEGVKADAATYAEELAQYEVKKKEYDEAMVRYRRETEQREREWKQKVDNFKSAQRDYEAKMKEYSSNLIEYNEKTDAYNKKYADYEQKLRQYQKDLSDYATKLADYDRSRLTGGAARAAYEKALAEYKVRLENYNRELENYNRDNQSNTIKKTEEIRRQNEYKEALRKYQSDLDQYRKDMDQYRKDLDQYNKEKDAAEKENARIKNDNQNNQADYEKAERQYQRDLAEYEREKTRIANEPALASGKGWKLVGSYGNRGEHFFDNITLTTDDPTIEVLESALGWGPSTTLKPGPGVHLRAGDPNNSQNGYTIDSMTAGSSLTLTNIGRTRSGKTVHLKVTARETLQADLPGKYLIYFAPSGFSSAGATDTYRKFIELYLGNTLSFDADYEFIDDNGQPIRLLNAMKLGDIDWTQQLGIEYNDTTEKIIPPGSKLIKGSNGGMDTLVYPTYDSGEIRDIDHPAGSAIVVGKGSSFRMRWVSGSVLTPNNEHRNSRVVGNMENPWATRNGVNEQVLFFFGSAGSTKVLAKPIPPTKPTPTPEKSFNKNKPNQPTEPKEPAKPQVEPVGVVEPPRKPVPPTPNDGGELKEKPLKPTKPTPPEKPWIEQPVKPVAPKDESGERPKPGTPPVEPKKPIAKNVTDWQDINGNTLKPREEGQLPDNEGDDIPGYKLVRIENKSNGDVLNVYRLVKTRWIDEKGVPLKTPVDGTYPDNEGDDIPGYELVRIENKDDGDTVNVYRKKPNGPITPNKKRYTRWVDDKGTPLKPQKDGEFPDTEGDDIPGYKLIRIERDTDGNVTNVYKKVKTRWVDEAGNPLKPETDGEYPDREGDDVPGYRLVKIVKDKDGNTINIYRKIPNEPTDPEKPVDKPKDPEKPLEKPKDPEKPRDSKKHKKTRWVDDSGKPLKPEKDGEYPDNEGDDVPGYKLIKIDTDKDGNVINIYKKVDVQTVKKTRWVDEHGTSLKPETEGTFPDKEGDDVPGYRLVKITDEPNGDTVNHYVKIRTFFKDPNGNDIIPPEDGDLSKRDIPGWKYIRTEKDKDGNTVHIYEKVRRTFFRNTHGNDIIPSEEGELEKRDLAGWTFVRTERDGDGNVIHIYTKVKTYFRDENGKDIIPSEDGEKEKRDISGWTYVRTEKDKDGNIIHIYKPTPKELPQTGDMNLALYGASALIGSIGTLKRRKRK